MIITWKHPANTTWIGEDDNGEPLYEVKRRSDYSYNVNFNGRELTTLKMELACVKAFCSGHCFALKGLKDVV